MKDPRAAEIRALQRQVRELRAALGEMLDNAEEMALGNYPHGILPRATKARLDSTLAWYMQHGSPHKDGLRADLRRIKRARRALGLPAWWERP